MYVFSERHKIVNAIIPAADPFNGNIASDAVHLENYKKCTFLVVTGADSAAFNTLTVLAGATNVAPAVAITFRYRTQIAAIPQAQGSDVSTTLTNAGVLGFPMTANRAGGLYIIEVDAAVVAAAGANFDHCALMITEDGGSVAQTACVIAILSEPRYPQDILATAID